MSKAFIDSWRLALVTLAILFCFGGVLSRLYYLHVWEREGLVHILERNREKLEVNHARRGNIVDARGNLLAATRSVIELGVDPQLVDPKDEPKWPLLARLIGLPLEDLKARITQKTFRSHVGYHQEVRLIQWRKLAESLDETTYEKILALEVDGIYGNRKYERVYPGNKLAAHLIGFINKDGIPVMGVESWMDFYLRGQEGWRETERDGRRRELAQFRSREVEATDGLNVETTIDIVIQHIIEEELKRLVKDYKPKSATIIASDPATGYILALGNTPSYNPNAFWKYPLDTHRNRAVADVFEPGSTFKIVTASGALNEELVFPETVLDCGLEAAPYRGRLVRLPRDHKPYGDLAVHELVAKSSNRGAAQLGMLLGSRRLFSYASAFGFGEFSGYDLGGEVKGVLHKVKEWDRLTISRLPMGYAISATPLQVHYAMSVIANQGVLMKPQVVRRIFDDEGRTVVSFSPRAKRRVISTHTAEIMAQLLTGVASSEGTAPAAAISHYEVAGKTGTTQKLINGRYSNQHHIASFVGFFPASRPQLVISVVVDEPHQGRGPAYGGQIAAPAFKRIAEKLIQYLAISPPEKSGEVLAWEGGHR